MRGGVRGAREDQTTDNKGGPSFTAAVAGKLGFGTREGVDKWGGGAVSPFGDSGSGNGGGSFGGNGGGSRATTKSKGAAPSAFPKWGS